MPHVLLCEDDVHLRNNISELLRAEGYSVSVSENAAGAERELRAHFPDLAVLDVLLPDGSGFDLCRRIHCRIWLFLLLDGADPNRAVAFRKNTNCGNTEREIHCGIFIGNCQQKPTV